MDPATHERGQREFTALVASYAQIRSHLDHNAKVLEKLGHLLGFVTSDGSVSRTELGLQGLLECGRTLQVQESEDVNFPPTDVHTGSLSHPTAPALYHRSSLRMAPLLKRVVGTTPAKRNEEETVVKVSQTSSEQSGNAGSAVDMGIRWDADDFLVDAPINTSRKTTRKTVKRKVTTLSNSSKQWLSPGSRSIFSLRVSNSKGSLQNSRSRMSEIVMATSSSAAVSKSPAVAVTVADVGPISNDPILSKVDLQLQRLSAGNVEVDALTHSARSLHSNPAIPQTLQSNPAIPQAIQSGPIVHQITQSSPMIIQDGSSSRPGSTADVASNTSQEIPSKRYLPGRGSNNSSKSSTNVQSPQRQNLLAVNPASQLETIQGSQILDRSRASSRISSHAPFSNVHVVSQVAKVLESETKYEFGSSAIALSTDISTRTLPLAVPATVVRAQVLKAEDETLATEPKSFTTIMFGLPESLPFIDHPIRIPSHCVDWALHSHGIYFESVFSTCWDAFMALFLFAVAFLAPYIAAFWSTSSNSSASLIIIPLILAIDTAANMLTPSVKFVSLQEATKDGEKSELLSKWIRLRWAITIFDMVTSFPFMYLSIDKQTIAYLYLIYLARVVRLPNLLSRSRILSVMRSSVVVKLGLPRASSSIIVIAAMLLMFVHFEACLLYYVGHSTGFSAWSRFSAWETADDVLSATNGQRYIFSLYQAVGNTFPMSYHPVTVAEQVASAISIILGAVLYACFVGTISSTAVGMDPSGRLFHAKKDELTEYITWKKVGSPTRERILEYYDVKYKGKFFEEQSMLATFNDSLRTEIAIHNCRSLIQKVPFLLREENDGRDEIFLGRIAASLQPVYFVEGDLIIRQGEVGSEMFFLENGVVGVIVNGQKITTLGDGSAFGEVALIANVPRTASVVAEEACVAYRLTKADFMSILRDFADMKARIDGLYQERMERVRREQAAERREKR